ncbi:hypothetical protein [Shimia thalassica]|uniref:Uncharacterized protein n=1 Tax=Shimia thalassica TaxID=1715693 RepID=A0A0P1I5Z6_9RHOB|nr:hypothetical protein [Shimia thalassica]MDO6478319.1 hypothetical protein [Shimia thalassica]CUJ92042.1 hypothetical protein PH7735_01441 [Shimia thalassica]
MKTATAILLGMLSATAATAEGLRPDRLYVPLASYHYNLTPPNPGQTSWNEFNPGLIFTWEDRFGTLDYSVGALLNSYEEVSPMFSVGKFWDVSAKVSLGAVASFVDYGDNARHFDVTLGGSNLAVLPALQVNYRNAFMQIVPAPDFNGNSGALFAFGATFALGD